jgi:nitrite reductase/ring-hydroxylating ferredoxin subunit
MRVPLIEDARVYEGQAAEVDFFGRSVLVLRTDGRVRAFMNVCAHLGGPLKLAPDGASFQCQWHQACFDARTGRPRAPLPAPTAASSACRSRSKPARSPTSMASRTSRLTLAPSRPLAGDGRRLLAHHCRFRFASHPLRSDGRRSSTRRRSS